jgi:hypothetical protein
MFAKTLLCDWANFSGVDPSLAAEKMPKFTSLVTFGVISQEQYAFSGSNRRYRVSDQGYWKGFQN